MKEEFWNNINNLAALAVAGDKVAYKQFLNDISTYLKKKISRTIPSNYQDDALQECLLAIHKSLHTLDTSKSCKPWINAIAHYKVCDSLRLIYKKQNETELLEHEAITDDLKLVESQQLVEEALSTLSAKERNVLLLVKHQGYSIKEAAKSLDKSESNIKVMVFRTMKKLRENLSKEVFYAE